MDTKRIIQIVLILLAFLLFLNIASAWGPGILLLNIVIALIALKIMGWLGVRVEVNVWSVLILLLGGIPGLLVVLFLSITGIAFKAKK